MTLPATPDVHGTCIQAEVMTMQVVVTGVLLVALKYPHITDEVSAVFIEAGVLTELE